MSELLQIPKTFPHLTTTTPFNVSLPTPKYIKNLKTFRPLVLAFPVLTPLKSREIVKSLLHDHELLSGFL